MTGQLEDQVAVITGAGRGIGRGVALVLASRGARVVVSDLDIGSAEMVAREIVASGGQAISVNCDVTDPKSTKELIMKATNELGQVDICVPNAGVVGGPNFETRIDFTEQDWDITYEVNLKGVVNTAQSVIPQMKSRRSGKIVIIASQGGRKPQGPRVGYGRQIIPYLVSKAAVIQWGHLLAQDLGQYNINVNCVCPGTVWTPLWERIANNRVFAATTGDDLTALDVYQETVEARHPLPVKQTPEDIGYAVAFLSSDGASEITGQALNVNAGAVLN